MQIKTKKVTYIFQNGYQQNLKENKCQWRCGENEPLHTVGKNVKMKNSVDVL